MHPVNRDSLPHIVACITKLFRQKIFTRLTYWLCRWWGIDIASDCIFDGLPYFYRCPGSQIYIGCRCRFNSSKKSNLIGINHSCMISTLREKTIIEIGGGCGFSGTVIGAEKQVVLGKNVRCGANTIITDTDWHTDDPGTGKAAAVIIEDDVWLGVNAVVLKGVTIGKGTIIGANSVVTVSLPAGVVAAGNPAKVIREIKLAVCK